MCESLQGYSGVNYLLSSPGLTLQAPGGTGAEGEGVPAGSEAESPAESPRPGALQTEEPACSCSECVILHYYSLLKESESTELCFK